MGAGVGRLGWVVCLAAAMGCSGSGIGNSSATLEISQPALDYGVVPVDVTSRQPITVRNAGRARVQLSALTTTEPFGVAEFPPGGVVLESGESRSFDVVFLPHAEGRYSASLALAHDASDGPAELSLKGEAVKAFVVGDRAALAFGQVLLGSSRTLTLQLTNNSGLAVTVPHRIAGFDASEFSLGALGSAPLVVGPGATVPVPVTFAPNHLGSAEATLYLTACVGCAETAIPLTGEGVASCLALDSSSIEFGTVDVGREVLQTVRVRNDGTAAVKVTEVFLASSSSPDFRFEGFVPGVPMTIPAGGTLDLSVFFKPASNGAKQGAIRLRAGSGADPCWAELRLSGNGGSGCLEVTPLVVDFGTVASGMSGRRSVFAANTSCGSDVWIEEVELTAPAEFAANPIRPAPVLVKQGEIAEIAVTFSPSSPGSYSGLLKLRATDDQHRPLAKAPSPIELRALSRAMAPCDLDVLPPRLEFGAVDVGARGTLAFKLRNVGQDSCYLSNLGLTANSAKAFSIAGANPGFVLTAGHAYDVKVYFAPTGTGPQTAMLEVYVSDPSNPYRTFPISGNGVSGCLSIKPIDLDFKTVYVGCAPPVLSSVVSNRCPGDVGLRSLVKGPGTSSEFSLLNPPAFPRVLRAGESLQLDVQYAPVDKGLDTMPLFLDDGTVSHLIGARGQGVVDPKRTDSFDQSMRQKVDVLFVLDNSGSMADKQAAVGANLASFLRNALAQNVDYRLAVTTTGIDPSTGGWTSCPGGAEGGEAGRLFPVDGSAARIITSATPNASGVWANNTNVGVCHWLEQGLESAYRALSSPLIDHADDPRTALANDGNLGFLRPDARLAIVFVSDEDDQSSAGVDFYLNFFRSLKPDPTMVSISVIVSPADLTACPAGTSSGTRYIELANRTGGLVESICTPDWAASLGRLGDTAFGAQSVFPLSAVPLDPAQIVVVVNGVTVPSAGNWTYDASLNAVRFEKGAVPGAGSHVEITYPLGCSP